MILLFLFILYQFIFTIRNRLKLSAEDGLFLHVNGNIPAITENMTKIYNSYKDEDGFLYLNYSKESTFG